MRLIGMLDSPFVRRVAVCFEHLQIDFRHEPVSVFSTFDQFRSINPVVKAPTLVCDDGTVLMDSTLILQFAEATLARGRSLWGQDRAQLAIEYRAVGLAMAACEKSAQLIYERNLRPPEAQFAPWKDRVTGQLLAAYAGLEQEIHAHPRAFERDDRHASIIAAIAWQFSYSMLAAELPAGNHAGLVQLSARMERSAQFRKFPPAGPGVPGLASDQAQVSTSPSR
jgi:glutathione S-transferase